ncbi:hypothetical protein D1871_21930 [Nakamurella silvestris]|nr:hypothetical protein D1871_21930 [Nakamurella silvestris]
MGLRDAFKSLRRDGAEEAEHWDTGAPDAAGSDDQLPDSTWFQPRTDGFYAGRPTDGDGAHRSLRFTVNGQVAEGIELIDPAAAWSVLSEPSGETGRGDYTAVGSFCVQRRFERPTVYTVLEVSEAAFVARCTATDVGTTRQYSFSFVPATAG